MNVRNTTKGGVNSRKAVLSSLLCLLVLLFASCESPYLKEDEQGGVDSGVNVILQFTTSSSRTIQNITELCTRISVAVFDQEGNKVKTVNQKFSDSGFGTVQLSLPAGDYDFVVIAHNGEGNATITSTGKVTFANNKVTDTFFCIQEISVTDDMISEVLMLTRCVAMIRYKITDSTLPENFTRLKFYYTGGSSTFSPEMGYGCVNSRQTEYRDRNDDGIYEIYTMPHEMDSKLTKLTVSALDANDQVLTTQEYSAIDITLNAITEITESNFFGNYSGSTNNSPVGSTGITMQAESDWAGVAHEFTF